MTTKIADSGAKVVVSSAVPADMKRLLLARAKADDSSISRVVRGLLAEQLRRESTETGP